MVKKTIRFFSVFIVILISSILLFDGFIIKHFIIKKSEELSGKRTIIDKVNLYYFPNIKIEVLGLKIPNPDSDNYIITSKQLMIEISLADLLKKKLVINNIISDNSKFFNDSEQPISLQKKNKLKEIKPKTTSVDFFNSFNIDDRLLNVNMISGELNPKIDLNKHFEDVDDIIATASINLKNNKDEVIKLSNQTLYQLNQLNIDNIKSINELESVTSKLNNINNNISSINSKITEFDAIYTDSFKQIKLIEESINKQIDNSFSLNIIENNTLISSNNNNFIKKRIQSFFQNLKSKTTKSLDDESKKNEPFQGITYHYQNNDSPIFLIKKIRINTIKDNEYLESEYLTLDKKYRQQFKLNFVQSNTNDFKNLKINSKAINANEVSFNIVINEINLKNRKLIENNDFIFNFESSKSNIVEIDGILAKNSRVNGRFNLISPTYKVINKTPKQSQIRSILTFIQNQDVLFEFLIKGNLNDFDLDITNNVLDIVDQAKNSYMSNKISNINKQKKRKINKLKHENNQILDDKVNSLYSNYNASLSSSRFQLNQVLNKQEQIKTEINNKQKNIEEELKSKIKDNLKSLNF